MDPLHWYDLEYAGWNTVKENLPKSPGTGPRGKQVLCLRFIDHPYLTAYTKGMQQVADAYGIQLKTLVANGDINLQSQQVDQAINERPDLVIITPVDATAVVPLLRKLNQAGIPVIASNLLPIDEGMKYVLAWTGPDDWGQFRMLAHTFADLMHYQGGYCIVRHNPGSSPSSPAPTPPPPNWRRSRRR
jgi:ribose transport system substrate-binding protein